MVRSKLGNGEPQWPQVEMALTIIPLIDFGFSHNNASNVTVSRQDGTGAGIGVQYCARVKNGGSSAANGIRYGTSLEATDVIGMRGKALTLSYYARQGPILAPLQMQCLFTCLLAQMLTLTQIHLQAVLGTIP